MKTIITVLEYNSKQISRHMKIESSTGSLLKKGYVVVENGSAIFFKTLKQAENFVKEGKWTIQENQVLPSDAEYDWGIEMSYRLTGSGTEHISLTKNK